MSVAQSLQKITEGYDYDFVKPGPTDEQKCPICFLVVRDAYQVNCCGKLLCKSCLMRYLEDHDTCPMCRGEVRENYFKDTKSNREILNLNVFCVYKNVGCEWSDILRSIDDHRQSCVYQQVECQDCEELMLKLSLDKHLSKDCPMRCFTCTLCNEEGTYLSITSEHQDACREVVLKCQNAGCAEAVKRYEMPSHVKVCPREVIGCPFSFMGCSFKTERENLTAHVEKGTFAHMNMMAQQMQAYHCVAPLVIKFNKFSYYKTQNKSWYSDGFYTGAGGYKIRLEVYPSGFDIQPTHMSVSVNLMPGVNDDTLEFPLKGKITVVLLNQTNDDNHYERELNIDDNTTDSEFLRKYELDDTGVGVIYFLPLVSLEEESLGDFIQYLKDDTLYFRVTVDIYSETKPWLACK